MNFNKKLILPISLSLVSVLLGLFSFTRIISQKENNKSFANWMSKLDDNTSIRDIAMPGSHDTMALYSIGNLAGQCQSLSLKDQLNLGVRFLDIRLKEENGHLKAVHGIVDEKADFKDITETINSFLSTHNKEFIIMSIKQEVGNSSTFESTLKSYLTFNSFLLDTNLPNNIGEVRGKALLLSRYENSTIGVPAYNGWQDSTSFVMNDIYIQDTFRITSLDTKKDEIIRCFNETGHALKINFLSAYMTNGFPPSYAPSAASGINPWINENIKNYHDRGIVLYDFVTKENMTAFFEGIL